MFGEIVNGVMVVNDIGAMVVRWWVKLAEKYENIQIDEYCFMPNHMHGIIHVGANPRVRPDNMRSCDRKGQTHGSAPTVSLCRILQWFKTMSTNDYIRHVNNNQWPSFNRRLWQRNYYERVIRDEPELLRIRMYIAENPKNWEDDPENQRGDR